MKNHNYEHNNKPARLNLGKGPYPISGKNLYKIYPDYWKDSWGPIPLLGVVTADDEFYAIRAAYDRKLLPMNYTFGPKPVYAKKAKVYNKTVQ